MNEYNNIKNLSLIASFKNLFKILFILLLYLIWDMKIKDSITIILHIILLYYIILFFITMFQNKSNQLIIEYSQYTNIFKILWMSSRKLKLQK